MMLTKMDRHHLRVGSDPRPRWGVDGAAEQGLWAQPPQRGKEPVPFPPRLSPVGTVSSFLIPKWSGPLSTSPASCSGLQGPQACISRGEGGLQGELGNTFLFGGQHITVTRGPHGRAMPPARPHYPVHDWLP